MKRAIAGALAVAILALVIVAGLGATADGGEGLRGPLTDATVVATLRTGARSYPEALRSKLRAAREHPDDRAIVQDAARSLIDDGRAVGDSRVVGAALGLLRPFLDDAPDPATLLLAATARQYQHDFNGALGLLDRAIAAAPQDPGARLTRATILTVQGHLGAARTDCQQLFGLGRPDLGFICQAVTLTLTADAPAVYKRLEVIAGQRGMLDPALASYAEGLMGEIAALQGWTDLAKAHLAREIAADPLASRAEMMLADIHLAAGDNEAALDALAGAPEVDGVLVRRAIAAGRLGRRDVLAPLQADLERRFRQNIALGLAAHTREEARYFLEVARDPALALARAKLNWALQHEIEDAQLLVDTAVAAGAPAAATPVLAWMAREGVDVPTLRIPAAVRDAQG